MSDELSIKELVKQVQEFFSECLRNGLLIGIIALLFAALFFYRAYQVEPTYSAKLTFMVNEDEGTSGGIGSLLGQFGFGMSRSSLNMDKIVELSRSRKIVAGAILNQGDSLVANRIIDSYKLQDKWKKAENGLGEFRFTHDKLDSFTRKENKALKALYSMIIGNPSEGVEGIVKTGYNESTGILKMTSKTPNEQLSIDISNQLYNKLKDFYIEKTVTNYEKTYKILQQKVDSLGNNLSQKNYALLKFEDSNRNLSMKAYQAKKISLQAEITKLSVAYTEAYKNLEVAEFALKNNTPDIVVIDEPIAPIKRNSESRIRAAIIGFLIGAFLSIVFIIGRKIYRDAMR